MTQEQLAERAEISKVTVSQLEQGLLDGVRLATLYALADALNVTVTSLFGIETEDDTVKEQDRALLLPLRRLLLPVVRVADRAVDEEELTLTDLRRRVLDCTADHDRARYEKIAAEVPQLIASVEAVVDLHENEAKADAYRLLAHAYIVTAQTLIFLRDESLACVAVGRAMDAAENAGDLVLRASAVKSYTWAFTRQGMFDDAVAVSVDMAAEIEPSMTDASPRQLAVWGELLRMASRAAAYDNRPDTASDLLRLAHSAAVRMDSGRMDYEKYWSVLNPAMIGITKAENALVGGDAALALRIGSGVRRTETLHLDMWTWHLLVRANAQTSTRDYAGAIATTKAVRELAPEWIRNNRVAHDVVTRLLDATTVRRARSSGLAELASFMDVKP